MPKVEYWFSFSTVNQSQMRLSEVISKVTNEKEILSLFAYS